MDYLQDVVISFLTFQGYLNDQNKLILTVVNNLIYVIQSLRNLYAILEFELYRILEISC